jgi:hypothetical protein
VLDFASFGSAERRLVVETLVFLPMFIAGFGCGFYLRDRILKKQRSRYVVDPRVGVARSSCPCPTPFQAIATPPVEPKRVQEIAAKQVRNSNLDIAAPLPPMDFKKISMSDELRELLSLLPSDEKQPFAKRKDG